MTGSQDPPTLSSQVSLDIVKVAAIYLVQYFPVYIFPSVVWLQEVCLPPLWAMLYEAAIEVTNPSLRYPSENPQ